MQPLRTSADPAAQTVSAMPQLAIVALSFFLSPPNIRKYLFRHESKRRWSLRRAAAVMAFRQNSSGSEPGTSNPPCDTCRIISINSVNTVRFNRMVRLFIICTSYLHSPVHDQYRGCPRYIAARVERIVTWPRLPAACPHDSGLNIEMSSRSQYPRLNI